MKNIRNLKYHQLWNYVTFFFRLFIVLFYNWLPSKKHDLYHKIFTNKNLNLFLLKPTSYEKSSYFI